MILMIYQNWIFSCWNYRGKKLLKEELREEIFHEEISFEFILQFAQVITCLGGWFKINYRSETRGISKCLKTAGLIYL